MADSRRNSDRFQCRMQHMIQTRVLRCAGRSRCRRGRSYRQCRDLPATTALRSINASRRVRIESAFCWRGSDSQRRQQLCFLPIGSIRFAKRLAVITQTSPVSTPTVARSIVVIGVSGSGKSTVAAALARHYRLDFLDADDFHSAEAKAQMASGVPLNDAQRLPWVRTLAAQLRQSAAAGRGVVLAFSGLRREHRALLRASGVPLQFVFLQADPALIAARLRQRGGHFMPASLLDSQYAALQPPRDEDDVLAVDVACAPAMVVEQAIAGLERLRRR